jgi:hypothetical protein
LILDDSTRATRKMESKGMEVQQSSRLLCYN